MFLAVGYATTSFDAPRPLGAAYVPILLSEVEQEQRPSGNGDRDGECERAYTVYGPVLGGEKNLKSYSTLLSALQEQLLSKNGTSRSQISRSIFDLAFRSHKNSIQNTSLS